MTNYIPSYLPFDTSATLVRADTFLIVDGALYRVEETERDRLEAVDVESGTTLCSIEACYGIDFLKQRIAKEHHDIRIKGGII